MDREIKFRGKRIDNGEWVCGFCAKFMDLLDSKQKIRMQILKRCIIKFNPIINTSKINRFIPSFKNKSFEVNPQTLGQYTGLYAKDEKTELWEKDIIKFKTTYDKKEYIGIINWGEYCYEVEIRNNYVPYLNLLPKVIDFNTIEKLGNIYDNQELLEE